MSHRSNAAQRNVEHSTNAEHDKPRRAAERRRDYTLGHAGRQFRLGPITFWLSVSIVLIMAVWSAATATYFAFRDDLLTRLIARQAEMQYSYEDRITDLRSQVDRVTSRQLLDQEQIEQRIEQLTRRQSTLESRTTTLSGLPDNTPTGSIRPGARGPVRGENNKPSPINDSATPGAAPDRHSGLGISNAAVRLGLSGAAKPTKLETKLARLEESLDRVEARQSSTLVAMEDGYEAKARLMRGVLAELGISPAKALAGNAPAGVGGPFLALNARSATNSFERQMQRVQLARVHMERLSQTLVAVPVRKPLAGDLDTSSGFGVRMDPFLRSPAMHSGLDFRGSTGDPVRATAAGKVASAGSNGGYGRMVEIDHGNGFSTRYGHLSEILVSEDQTVRPGQLIGRVGSTGRSTGPHLHYETRIDGDAVDPQRFLRAGMRLGEKM